MEKQGREEEDVGSSFSEFDSPKKSIQPKDDLHPKEGMKIINSHPQV